MEQKRGNGRGDAVARGQENAALSGNGPENSIRKSAQPQFCALRRAYFNAPVQWDTSIALLEQDADEKMCGKLRAPLYSARDAVRNWEER